MQRQETTFSSSLFVFLCFVCLRDQNRVLCKQTVLISKKFAVFCCFFANSNTFKAISIEFGLILFILHCFVAKRNIIFNKRVSFLFLLFLLLLSVCTINNKRNESFCANRQFFLSFLFRVSLSISLSFLVFMLVFATKELFVFRFVVDFNSKHKELFLILN